MSAVTILKTHSDAGRVGQFEQPSRRHVFMLSGYLCGTMMTTEPMPLAGNNDAELVARCLNGSGDAFAFIVKRYQALICSLAYSATGNLGQSEDLAQETFLTAWKHLPELREAAKLRSWLCGIARNLIGKSLRKDGRQPTHAAEPLGTAPDPVAAEPLPCDRAISHEEEGLLWRALEQIPALYREPMVLFYREHQSAERVAAALDLSEETVRQRLSRGRKLLHQQVMAFVEGALEDTGPGTAFTVGVLAALPVLAASTAGAGAATAGTVAAKGGATAKTAGALGAVGAVLTAGLICFFSLLGFLAFLGGCTGYIMGRAIRRSAKQLDDATRFWRAVAIGCAVFIVAPLLCVFGLGLSANAHPALYQALTLWMGLIYALVPGAVAAWLWRWWRETRLPEATQGTVRNATGRRFLLWLGLGMLVPACFFGVFGYAIAFQSSLSGERLSGTEFQRIISEHKDAEFTVTQYQNGSKVLSVRLPESRRLFFTRANQALLGLLAEDHVAYKTTVAGRDFDQLGAPWRLAGLLGFFVVPAGLAILLRRPWRQDFFQHEIDPGQPVKSEARAQTVFRTLIVATAVGLFAPTVFLGLITRWGMRNISAEELPGILSQYKFARYCVAEYGNGTRKLFITPRENEMSPFVIPGDQTVLARLEENAIPYRVIVQGRDFGHADPTPMFSLVCIIVLWTAAAVLLWWSAQGTRRWPRPFLAGFLPMFLLVFGAGVFWALKESHTYVSTARVKVAEWTHPAFPQDESGVVESDAILGKAIQNQGLNRPWAQRWSRGRTLEPARMAALLRRFVRVDSIPLDDRGVLEVSVYDPDPDEAAALANAISNAYLDARNRNGTVAQILDAAVPGQQSVSRFKPAALIIGALAGGLLGSVVGVVCARLTRWRGGR